MSTSHNHLVRFQKHLKTLGADAYWVTHIPDLFYLTGFGCEMTWALVGPTKALMIVPGLAEDQARALTKGVRVEIVSMKRGVDVLQLMVDTARKNGYKTVGYDGYKVPEAYLTRLRKLSGKKPAWISIANATTPLRIKKDLKEVAALRAAGHLVAKGFAHIQKIARAGMSESDLAADFEAYIRKNGATKTSFDSIVAFGENAAYPHYITGYRKLRKNDIVLCDIGALVDGYCSDLTRTFFFGTISEQGKRIYDIVNRAQKQAIQAIKPGVKTAHIDRIARDEIERAGYGRRFIHSTGHGVGVEIHEAPGVGPGSTETLEAGMIITVEPGIYLEGWGGVRIEDTLLVTKTGYEVLTK